MKGASIGRVLITGANSGIGYYAALELARRGATVILACRDATRAAAAVSRLSRLVPAADIRLLPLDLASLSSVREAAQREVNGGVPLDVLINNAGVMAPPTRRETADGFELQFGTNVLGHFLLTALLMPALSAASAARVVTVASVAHKRGALQFEDLQSEQRYEPMRAYAQSKLADLMFALELARRLHASGLPVTSLACHPGVAATNLFSSADSRWERALRSLGRHAIGALLNSGEAGALPSLYAATASEASNGGYYGPQGLAELRGRRVAAAQVAPQARDPEATARLWAACETLTGVRFLDPG